MKEEEQIELRDYLDIVLRRKWLLIVPAIVGLAATVAVALLLPPVYRSSATILIEAPEVTPGLVGSTITSFVDQRLLVISRRMMASANLAKIIDKYDLYSEERQRARMSEVIETMRENISMDLITAEISDATQGRVGEATIASTVAFDHEDPDTAQRVASEIVSLYIGENLRDRREKARQTAAFLRVRARSLEKRIEDLEQQQSDLKQKYAGSLPELFEYNVRLVEEAKSNMRELNGRALDLKQRQIYLGSELALTHPYGSYVVDGVRVMGPEDELKALRTRLLSESAVYGPEHPEVINLRQRVEALQTQLGNSPNLVTLRRERDTLQTQLAKAREQFTAEHPDVVRLERQVQRVEAALASAARAPRVDPTHGRPDNPAYIQLQAQYQAVQSELVSLAAQRALIGARIAEHQEKIAKTPLVERESNRLAREHEAVTREYEDVTKKLLAAEMGQELENERKAERLSLIEPPNYPTEPIKPNRRAIVAIGFILSLAVGVGLVTLRENFDTAVYTVRQLQSVTKAAPLVVIPRLVNRADRARTLASMGAATAVACIILVVGSLAILHFREAPLDDLWTTIQRNLEAKSIQR